MMETAEVEDRAATQSLIANVPVQMVQSEARVEVVSKLTPVTVTANGVHQQDLMTATQYINIHRMPEQLNKVLVNDTLSGDLLSHHVDLSASADFTQHAVTAQYYDTDDLLTHGLTEEDRRLAAELVAVQLKHQQQQNAILSQDLLGSKTITPLGTVQVSGMDKPTISASIVTSYIQAVEDEAVHQQLLEQQETQERCIMKIYPQQSAPPELQYNTIQVLSRQQTQPLPPLKKVLSSQSMILRNKYTTSPGIMVQLPDAEIMEATAVGEECVKAEGIEEAGGGLQVSQQAVCASGTPLDDLDSDYDAESDTRPSRRSLPHKKRIPRKLKAPPARSIHTKCYKCNKCGESFNTQAAFSSHKVVHAPPSCKRPSSAVNSFNCELCSKQFTNQLKFFEHLKQHYEPPGANNGTNNVVVTTTTNITVNTNGVMSAGGPDSGVPSSQQLPELTPAPTVTCVAPAPVPQEQTTIAGLENALAVKSELSAQEEVVTSTGLACDHCGKTFKRQKTLESHISVAHPRQEEIEEFSEPEDMMEGIRHVVNIPTVDSGDEEHVHVDEKLRWRYQVGGDYSSIQDLGMDLQDMCQPIAPAGTGPLPEEEAGLDSEGEKGRNGGGGSGRKRQLNCPECDRVFNHRNSLLYHIRSHSGQRPHQCEVCGKSFFSASALKVHMRLHSGDKPYKCEFCGRHFRQWGDLKYHVTSLHSDQKQFQCEFCGKDFARKYSLIVHRRIHTGEKNYRCEFCLKTFRASSYLQNHRRIHTGEKPHPCDVCGKPFRVRSDMKRHRHTHNRERPSSRANSSANVVQGSVSDQEESTETILPDSAPAPLNLNIRQGPDSNELSYSAAAAAAEAASRGATAHALDRDGNTLYVWIPAQPDSILSDE